MLPVGPLMRSLILMSCFIALAGCASSNPGNLKKTAMADLGCPAKKLEIDQLHKSRAGSTYLVSGCGRSAQYSVTRKVAVRTSEVMATNAPPAPVEVTPAPPPAPNAQQQADFNAFMQEHNDNFARHRVGRENSVNSPPSPPARGVSGSASQTGYVCLNGAYHACPTVESTAALGAYGVCKVDCAMGGSCSSCVVGAGDQCKREPGKDSSCK